MSLALMTLCIAIRMLEKRDERRGVVGGIRIPPAQPEGEDRTQNMDEQSVVTTRSDTSNDLSKTMSDAIAVPESAV